MGKRKFFILLIGVIAVCSGCSMKNASNHSQKAKVTEIISENYISADGQTMNQLVYRLENGSDIQELTPKDFTITLTVEPNAMLGEKESQNKTAKIKDVTVEKTSITVELEGILYTSLEDVDVDCTNDSLDCKMSEFKVKTRTVDEFVKNTFTTQDGTELVYWLYMPENAKNIPLMVWEHGGGEALEDSYEGANLCSNRGAVTWIENGFDTAVLSVQYPKNYSFGITEKEKENTMMEKYGTAKYELIQKLISEGKINPDRIYLCGASSGGGGALRFAMQYPALFAAVVPICAKDTVIPLSEKYNLSYQMLDSSLLKLSEEDYQAEYKNMFSILQDSRLTEIPIWFIHAENDPVCTYYTSEMMYNILQDMGAKDNRITLYSDEEMRNKGQEFYHSAWVLALDNKEVLEWVYEQSR